MEIGSVTRSLRPRMAVGEIFNFAYDTFCSNKVRFALTALGMVIGTASLILVVTIGMTGKQYVLSQIQAIGANLIFAEYEGGAQRITNITPDPLTIDDMNAVLAQVPGIVHASPVVPLDDRIPVGGGKERDVRILGVYPEYQHVRNLVILSGRFFDKQDAQARNKVAVITQKMAEELYGSSQAAVGKVIKLSGLPFTIVPLRGLEVMSRLRVDLSGSEEYLRKTGGQFFYFVTRETMDSAARLHARMMFYNGEDPATGSAAGCAAAWMVANGIADPEEQVLIEQGIEMHRPSRIFVRASRIDDRVVNVRVGGNVVEVVRGEIFF